ncbi:unnamed protein product [Symbiodinium natans]|uniref:Uncharacterized protein n=1 Tax=Symbiodinium natans TaxID=878477 RepID=A0A812U4X1_9DINO|nr:unnamed protein product [Symbiodinium natans]
MGAKYGLQRIEATPATVPLRKHMSSETHHSLCSYLVSPIATGSRGPRRASVVSRRSPENELKQRLHLRHLPGQERGADLTDDLALVTSHFPQKILIRDPLPHTSTTTSPHLAPGSRDVSRLFQPISALSQNKGTSDLRRCLRWEGWDSKRRWLKCTKEDFLTVS